MDRKEIIEIIDEFWNEYNPSKYSEYGNNFDKFGTEIIKHFTEYCKERIKEKINDNNYIKDNEMNIKDLIKKVEYRIKIDKGIGLKYSSEPKFIKGKIMAYKEILNLIEEMKGWK